MQHGPPWAQAPRGHEATSSPLAVSAIPNGVDSANLNFRCDGVRLATFSSRRTVTSYLDLQMRWEAGAARTWTGTGTSGAFRADDADAVFVSDSPTSESRQPQSANRRRLHEV